jgi:hypothetical protein
VIGVTDPGNESDAAPTSAVLAPVFDELLKSGASPQAVMYSANAPSRKGTRER